MIRLTALVVGTLALPLAAYGAPAENGADPVESQSEDAAAMPVPDDTATPSEPVTTGAAVAAAPCGADRVEPWIGQEATVPVRRAVAEAADAATDRWIYPDSMVTQDRRIDRLNVLMEKDTDIILRANCG